MITPVRFAACAAMLLSAAACGLKGPLYMPGSDAPSEESATTDRKKQDPGRRIPAPQSQKKDRETQPERSDSETDNGGIPGGNEAPLTPPGGDRPATAPPPQGTTRGADE